MVLTGFNLAFIFISPAVGIRAALKGANFAIAISMKKMKLWFMLQASQASSAINSK
jgi:hypothetical protein